ncbi:MAG: putative metal-binding motif-containing protein [Planctomycetaceae bacterium]|nr:putative metal-binding motif-containing protein [Planctomycetaceae bacterium]
MFVASAESSWVPGDSNGVADIFRRTACFEHYLDGDLDGYGSPTGAQLQCLPPPAGWLLRAGDCDDTRASVNPAGIESCNGLDDDCDGTVDEGFAGTAYCAATPTAIGCVPVLLVSGCLSATQPAGCSLSLSGAPSSVPGLILYGFAPASQPWVPGNPSVLCVAAPRQRTTLQTTSTVNACGGEFSLDFPAWAALHPGALGLPLSAGQVVHFQGWLREPGYPGGTMLTRAWKVTVSP